MAYTITYIDTRDGTKRTLLHAATGQPFKKLVNAEISADRIRAYDWVADVAIEST